MSGTGRARRTTRRLRSQLALGLSAMMVVTLLQTSAMPSAAADSGRPDRPDSEEPVEGRDGLQVKQRNTEKGSPPGEPRAEWPEPGTAEVALPAASAITLPAAAGDLPLTLTGDGQAVTADVALLDEQAGAALGTEGPVITVTAREPEQSGVLRPAEPPQADVALNYSEFADSFGGNYAARLTLVELPACALDSPEKPECQERTTIAAENDTERQVLTAGSVSLASAQPVVLAVTTGAESESGDYKATDLAPSATWDTDLNTGDFTWSHEMSVPEVPGGLTPNVGLSYSSGSIDGRSGGTNNQGSWAGDGFDLWPGYIERKYKPCGYDDVENDDGHKVGDLCWDYDNAFLSFNGSAGELVPAGSNTWKLANDDGTKVELLKDSARANGDNDNEYWRVTTSAGVQYHFGYHRLPGWSSGRSVTNSTWTVPVFGNDSGDPCHSATLKDAWCQQAWRWNLDYVVDPRGNAVTYYYNKEQNSYGRFLDEEKNTRYTRGGTLDRIEYGQHKDTLYSGNPLARVQFTNSDRCLPGGSADCSDIEQNAHYWYDTPWDLNCKASEDCDSGRFSPTFWTTKRLTEVTTQIRTGTTWKKVDSWKLAHHWGTADIDYQLLLSSVQHTGHTDAAPLTLPKTTFGYTQLANRMDETGDGYAPFIKARLSSVADEAGGQIDVEYSAPACKPSSLPTPETNTTRCFPQNLAGGPEHDPDMQWFNKYVVTAMTATDRTGGAPDEVTRYSYLGGAAWHYDDGSGLVPEEEKTWSQWRGYGHVRVRTGGQGTDGMISQSDSYFLRGMDGDRRNESGGKKTVTVTLGAGEGDPLTDHASAAGFAYKTVTFSGVDGKVLEKTVSRPWHHETAKKVRDWGTLAAHFTGTAHTKTWTSLDDGAGSQWRTSEQYLSYDTVAGRLTRVDDRGDTSTTTDDRCTRTTYATNTAKNLLDLPSREESLSVRCSATPDRSSDVISDTRYAYDGKAYGETPAFGSVTGTAELKDHNGTTATYVESGATHDSYGRPLTATDLAADVTVTGSGTPQRTPRTDGRTATTVYSPATGFATKVTETTPPAKTGVASSAMTTVTDIDPARGMPLKVTDANGKITHLTHDALGRSTKVWLPDRSTTTLPSYEFTYRIVEGQPVAVGTKTIGNRGVQDTSYVIYDGFLRERQTQNPGPDGGRLLTDAFYDERGLTSKTFASYYVAGAPSASLFLPSDESTVESQTRHTYDGVGRETQSRLMAGDGDGGKVLSLARTLHGGDRTTVIPPVGGTATTTLNDARGQLTELRQHHEPTASASYDTTRYAYTGHGELADVTDPAGNRWTYTYDQLGRQISSTDPDAGTVTHTYDDRGQKLSTTNEAGDTLAYVYDGLGRRTQIREDDDSGPLRAEWVFDTVNGAKGRLASSTRWENGQAYTTRLVQYDQLYRSTRSVVIVPQTEGALAGSYVSSVEYEASGLTRGMTLPAAGNLPGQGVSFAYEDGTRRQTSTTLSQTGLRAEANYSLTGKPLQFELSRNNGPKVWATNTYEWGTQRLKTARVDRENQPGVDRHETYAYDPAGNVQSIADVSRTGTDVQCFGYDYLRRLTEAWTQGAQGCAEDGSAATIGGPAPYHHSYTYDEVGNRLTETLHEQDTTRTYGYSETQPHAVTEVVQDAPGVRSLEEYGYDANGNTTSRQLGGETQTLSWNAEGRVEKVTDADGTTAEYLYDADGNRLIGRTAAETTLYLGHTEVTLPTGSSTAEATRYLELGGGHMAVVTNDGTASFTLADHHGTGHFAVEAGTQAITQRRTLPFGSLRGDDPGEDWPGSRGFVGGVTDTATGLTHLQAREYDPALGRFISLDPIMDLVDPQQIHGYTYGNNNPLAFSDPTGLFFDPSRLVRAAKKIAQTVSRWTSAKSKGLRRNQSSSSATQASYTTTSTSSTQPVSQPNECAGSNSHHCTTFRETGEYPRSAMHPGDTATGWEVFKWASSQVFGYEDWKGCAYDHQWGSCGWAATDIPFLKWGKAFKIVKGKKATSPCQSFLPGTHVLMVDGETKPIDDIEIGDKVLATDPTTGETTARTVTAEIFSTGKKSLVSLTVAVEGQYAPVELVATDGHPFWVPALDTWVDATDLQAGTWLQASDGALLQVTAVQRWAETTTVYNLTVEGVHTYYVLAGHTPVLVHNSGGTCGTNLTRGEKVAAASGVDDLSPALRKNLTGFMKKSPGDAEIPQIIRLRGGGAEFSYKVPGRVPGSYAVYRKRVDAEGVTELAYKTTFLPDGRIAHIKFK
ncbi:polymorphic toxin-type HINT domain-containing protein [Streptomyces sp. ACA25]|uniref:polymorphic toxin-type HINT domain-containing protein n=1 Tax=Streptomyces sp. ACA25 TaxID=3022596 RepID=UPI002307C3E5|nr:polymorphic toxin-type HINT domain-containing protein [Streptomyces sp. ACA25]MDB1088173.1 polymorphic toxin-type HINT domain-containing protein [Streptomyces sp. ACA25]